MTDRWLSFNPVIDPLWLNLILIASLLFFIFLEWKKPARHTILRIILIAIGSSAVAGLLFRPQLSIEKTDSIILLTENYDREKVDSVLKRYPGANLVSLPGNVAYNEARPLSTVHELEDVVNDIDFVIGDGLSNSTFDILSGAHFTYVKSSLPEGIVDLRMPTAVILNRPNKIYGSINNPDENQKIVLEGPGGAEDSIAISTKGITNFELNFTPRQAGNFLYTLHAPKKSEKLPVTVTEQTASDILFLQQYPTFETRYLKQMLGEKHNLLFRYELSKNVFRFEKINDPGKEFQRISSEVLDGFDLLIIDTDAFSQLSSNEIKALKTAVKDGLGVILLFNDQPDKNVKSFLPFTMVPYNADTAQFQLANKKVTLPSWPLEVKTTVTPSLRNKKRILAGYANDGFGKVGFQLLQETYRLALEGDSLGYANLWSDLLEKVVRTKQVDIKVNVTSPFPIYPDEPVEIEIVSNEDDPEVFVDSVSIPLAEDPQIDGLWRAKVWFDKPGWQNIKVEGQTSGIPIFVSTDSDWRSLSRANNIRRSQTVSSTTVQTSRPTLTFSPINPIIFYLLFLLAFGILWLLPKV